MHLVAHFRRSAALFKCFLDITGDDPKARDDHGKTVAQLLTFHEDDRLVTAVHEVDEVGVENSRTAANEARDKLWIALEASAVDTQDGAKARATAASLVQRFPGTATAARTRNVLMQDAATIPLGDDFDDDGGAEEAVEGNAVNATKGTLVRLMTRLHFGPPIGGRGIKTGTDVYSGLEFGEYRLDYDTGAVVRNDVPRGIINGCWTWTMSRQKAVRMEESHHAGTIGKSAMGFLVTDSDYSRDSIRPLHNGMIHTTLFRTQSKEWCVAEAESVSISSKSDLMLQNQPQQGKKFLGEYPVGEVEVLPLNARWQYFNTLLDKSGRSAAGNELTLPAGWLHDDAIKLRLDGYANSDGPIAVVLGDADSDGCVDIRLYRTNRVLPKIPIALLQHASKGCYPLQLAVELAHADDTAFSMLQRMLSVVPAAAPAALAAACRHVHWTNTPGVIALLAEAAFPSKGEIHNSINIKNYSDLSFNTPRTDALPHMIMLIILTI